MMLLAVPNLSEGRDARRISSLADAVSKAGAYMLDTHTDEIHNRSVFTVTAGDDVLIDSMVRLAVAARELISLVDHSGVHPRLGALDVCPFVPFRRSLSEAATAARAAARRIGESGIPVFLYGAAGGPSLPELRRGGIGGLIERIEGGNGPDFGPASITPETGVVCVGARGPLIAFNVNIDAGAEVARRISRRVRARDGGLEGVRALGLPMPVGSQVSMNITDPEQIGIDDVFGAVAAEADRLGVQITSTEIVGLMEERFLPAPDAKAARLLIKPGRSIESALES